MSRGVVMRRDMVGRPMEILLVEDSLLDARLAVAALDKAELKHRLTIAGDGEEAIEFLQQQGRFARAPRPDLILLDLVLPKKDGLEVLQTIRSDEKLQSIPVVVLTGVDSQDEIERCKSLHVDSYITKPLDLAKFLSTIRELKANWMEDVILPGVD